MTAHEGEAPADTYLADDARHGAFPQGAPFFSASRASTLALFASSCWFSDMSTSAFQVNAKPFAHQTSLSVESRTSTASNASIASLYAFKAASSLLEARKLSASLKRPIALSAKTALTTLGSGVDVGRVVAGALVAVSVATHADVGRGVDESTDGIGVDGCAEGTEMDCAVEGRHDVSSTRPKHGSVAQTEALLMALTPRWRATTMVRRHGDECSLHVIGWSSGAAQPGWSGCSGGGADRTIEQHQCDAKTENGSHTMHIISRLGRTRAMSFRGISAT